MSAPVICLAPPGQQLRWPQFAVRTALVLILVGAVIRIAPWVQNRSLWYDEAALAQSIVHRSFAGLIRPLDHNQAAPIGFLWMEKMVTLAAGDSERALRLPPLVFGVAMLFIVAWFAQRVFDPLTGIACICFFVFAPGLRSFSSELKQYEIDAAIAILLTLAAWLYHAERGRWHIAWGLVAALGVWFSHAAVFVIVATGLCIAAKQFARRDWQALATHSCWVAVSAAGFIANYLLFMSDLEHNQYLRSYWQSAFLPQGDLWQQAQWAISRVYVLGKATFGRVGAWACVILAVAGVLSLWRENRARLVLLIGALAPAFLAALVAFYPFGDRLLLFAVPGVLILCAIGVGAVIRLPVGHWRWAGLVVAAWMVSQPALLGIGRVFVPWSRCDLRPVMEQVEKSARPGDVVYVTEMTRVAFDYYSARFTFPARCELRPIGDEMQGIDELIQYPGRTWLITAVIGDTAVMRQREILGKVQSARQVQERHEAAKAYAILSTSGKVTGSTE